MFSRNAYTYTPKQYPNLILGSLQLLWWMFFRPRAWVNHLNQIAPVLKRKGTHSIKLQWRNPAPELYKFLFQGFIVLPIVAYIILSLALWKVGVSLEIITTRVAFGLAFGLVGGLAFGLAWGLAGDLAGGLAVALAGGLVFGFAFGLAEGLVGGSAVGLVTGLTVGLAVGLTVGFVGLAFSLVDNLAGVLTVGLAFGLAGGLAGDLAAGLAVGLAGVLAGSLAGGLAFGLVFGLGSGLVGDLAAGLGFGLVAGLGFGLAFGLTFGLGFGLAAGLGLTIHSWRPAVLYPFITVLNNILYRLDQRSSQASSSLLCWNSAFWDECQYLPLQGLEKHLVLVMERNPIEGNAAIKYLSSSIQCWAAQAAQIEVDARSLERCVDIEEIRHKYDTLPIGELESPARSFFNSFSRISEDIDAALNQRSNYNQRLALTAVAEHLDALLRELTRSGDKYAVRFIPTAHRWCQIVTNYVKELTEAVELHQEIDSPYIIGVPLKELQEIFFGRKDISSRIEQLLLDRRRPPLLLYGQRRMGKTSLLNNLGRLLPSTIIPLFIDLQGPVSSASDYTGFLYNIARGMTNSATKQRNLTLPSLTREDLASDPFTYFDEWLDKVEQALEKNIALLSFDEFEVLDSAITRGRFDEQDVLGMLRHLIQHRPRFKVLICGSHTIEEFQRLASYLINVQVVHISYLKEPEARKLIEQPVPDFALRYEPDAVERVLSLTRCHPFLVQLLCAEIVVLKNEQPPAVRRLATLVDVEAAIPEALSSGSFFFADIQNNQVDATGLALLRFLAAQGEGSIVSQKVLSQEFKENLDIALQLLRRRELIEAIGDGYRYQVELLRRWFAK